MNESEEIKEPGEQEPKGGILMKVDWVRHGEPRYTDEELTTSQFDGILTEEGHQQIWNTVRSRLLPNIDGNKEIVAIWASPKGRSQQSVEAIKEILEGEGVPILEVKKRESLKDVHFTEEFGIKLYEKGLWDDWMRYWLEAEELPVGVEKPKEFDTRIMRVLTYLSRIAQKIKPHNDKIFHFILVGHGEILERLLEKVGGLNTKQEPPYGADLQMGIKSIGEPNCVQLDFNYQGQTSSSIFNYRERKLEKI